MVVLICGSGSGNAISVQVANTASGNAISAAVCSSSVDVSVRVGSAVSNNSS
jgi:hypothetical protein